MGKKSMERVSASAVTSSDWLALELGIRPSPAVGLKHGPMWAIYEVGGQLVWATDWRFMLPELVKRRVIPATARGIT